MNKDIIVEKIKYLTSLPHSALVEHCIYLENENDNYKAQKYITDLISENGVICEKNKEIEQLQQKIDKTIEYIKHIDDFDIKDFVREKLLKILEE